MPPHRTYAAFLAPVQLRDMERTIPKNSSIWKLGNWQAVKEAASDAVVDVLYIDFGLELKDPCRTEALVEIRRSRKPVVSTIGEYFTREIVEELFSLTKLGLIDNVAFNDHLHSGEWSLRVREEPSSRLGQKIVKRIAPRLANLKPGSLKAAVESMFLKPRMIETVGDLARASSINERSIVRSCKDARLANPNTLVTVSKLIHAFPLLKESDATLEIIARRCGWGSMQSFQDHCKQYLEMTPSVVREECTEEEFLARVMLCLIESRNSKSKVPM